MGNTSTFKLRYQYWKETGELPYLNGIKRNLQSNLVGSSSVESGILPRYDGGKDGMTVKYVNSYRVNPETGGVYDAVGDIKEGAVILPEVEVTAPKPEFMRILDEMNRMRSIQMKQGLSGSDPLGQFVVEGVALNPALKALGTAGLYTLGRYGESLTGFAKPQNWARAKLLTREMNRSPFGTIGSPVLQPAKRTRIGDVEIDNPGLYYHQSDAGKAENFVSTGRMRTPLEEYWLAKEEAGERIPLAIRSGIEPGYPQDPGSTMFAQGGLWYDKLDGVRVNPKKPDLLVTAKEMPIANKNASIMSNKASLKTLYEQGSRRVTNDNIYTQGPHNRQNTTAYTWEPGYGYRRVLTESPTTIGWADAARTPRITAENTASITTEQWTAAQDAAIARGDMVEAQRLRDLHFTVNSSNNTIIDNIGMPRHVYHGTESKPFNVFDINAPRKHDLGTYGKGFYFTPNKTTAISYGNNKTLFDAYLNLKNPYSGSEDIVNNVGNFKNLKELKDYYKRQGFSKKELDDINWGNFDIADGVNAGNEIMVLKPNQIKLADAVTYDDKGVRIPLGKRDSFKLNDIRYGLLPFLGLGAAGTLYRTPSKK